MSLLEIKTLHVHIHAAVNGGVGSREHAGDGEGIVHEAVVGAVRGGEEIARVEAEAGSDLGAEHAAEELVVAEVSPRRKREGLRRRASRWAADEPPQPAAEARGSAATVGQAVEVGGIGADHAKALEVVPHADRHGGPHAAGKPAGNAVGPGGGGQKLLVEAPGDVLDRLADQVHAIEDQLQRAPLRPHDHVVAEARTRVERLRDDVADHQRGHDERHAECQRQGREAAGQQPLSDVAPGDAEQRHGKSVSQGQP